MAVHADREYNVSAAGIFNIVKVLHLTVIVPAVTDNDCGSFVVHSCGFWHEQECVKLVTACGNKGHIVVFYLTEARLENHRTNRAYQTEDKGNNE